MRVLIVGGTGLTGAHAALHLRQLGHNVTLMSRSAPQVAALSGFPHIAANYTDGSLACGMLEGFDALVFAAGADIRLLPPDEDEDRFFTRVNTEAIPAFFDKAKAAGIARAVYIGTYYPQVAPEKIDSSPYVRSRYLADTAVRALNAPSFNVCSLNAPFILGRVPGLSLPHIEALVHYASGRLDGVPLVAPLGGVNHISSRSMSEAIAGALAHGRGGHGYLVGDENLSWKEYLERFFDAAGNPQDLPVSADEHPLFPDVIMYAGRNATVSYEPENGELNYSRHQIAATIDDIVKACL
ncbi:MAG: NAD-dependent epimerase/dehydratase family protein [Halioglobus sp.]|nr:NAD-dependent epimerase/dehydratase family protein [Halioglobus sp.]